MYKKEKNIKRYSENFKLKVLSITLIFAFAFSLNSCDKNEDSKDCKVMFCTNSHMINCVFEIEIFINNEKVGILNASTVFSDGDCKCENTLDIGIILNLEKGIYTYVANEINCVGTNKINTWNGQIEVTKETCSVVFLDIIK